MLHNTKEIGDQGEALAAAFLAGKGYRVLEKNWKHRHLEIDLIAIRGPYLVVVEVKTRAGADFGMPETFVNKKKQQFLIRAANVYIAEKSLDLETRFDVISILNQGESPRITHIEDAFYPLLR